MPNQMLIIPAAPTPPTGTRQQAGRGQQQYSRIHIAPHDAIFDGWFVIGTRTTGQPVPLGAVSTLDEAELLAARHRVALTVSDEVRSQMRARSRATAAWQAA